MRQSKETIRIGQLELHFLLDGKDTNHELVIFEFLIMNRNIFKKAVNITVIIKVS